MGQNQLMTPQFPGHCPPDSLLVHLLHWAVRLSGSQRRGCTEGRQNPFLMIPAKHMLPWISSTSLGPRRTYREVKWGFYWTKGTSRVALACSNLGLLQLLQRIKNMQKERPRIHGKQSLPSKFLMSWPNRSRDMWIAFVWNVDTSGIKRESTQRSIVLLLVWT